MGSTYSRWNREQSEQYQQIKTVNRATFTVDAPADTNSGHLRKADSKLAPFAYSNWDDIVSSTAVKANEKPRLVKNKKDKREKNKEQGREEEETVS